MAKSFMKGLQNWLRATRESTDRASKDVLANVKSADITARALTETNKGIYADDAQRFIKEHALNNPEFGLATKYGQKAKGVQQVASELEGIKIKENLPKDTNYAKRAGLKKQLSFLTGTDEQTLKEKSLLEEMIATTDSKIRESKMTDISFPEEAVTRFKQKASIFGLDPDMMEAELRQHNFAGIKSKITAAAEDKAYKDFAVGSRDLCYERKLGEVEIEKIFNDPTLNWKQKGTKFAEMATSAQNTIAEAMDQAGVKIDITGLGKIEGLFTSVGYKLGDAIRYANDKGHVLLAKSFKRFGDLDRNAPVMKSKLTQLNHDFKLIDERMGVEKEAAIRAYMDGRVYSKAVLFSDSAMRDPIKVNPETVEAVFKTHGIKLGYDDLKYANKKASMLRETLRFYAEVDQQHYDEAAFGLPKSIRDFDGVGINRAQENFGMRTVKNAAGEDVVINGIGDTGPNYTPRVGTEEWLEGYLKSKPEDSKAYRDAVGRKDYGTQLKFMEHTRTNSQELTIDANRLPAHEELDKYMRGLMDLSIKREGTRILQQSKFLSAMPLGKVNERSMSGEQLYVRALENQWNINFNPANAQESNWLSKLLLGYSRAAIPVALTGNKMIPSNSIQAVFTASYRHGYVRTITATAKALTDFGRQVVLHPTRIREAFDLMASGQLDRAMITGKNAGLAEVLYKYQKNNPGLSTMVDEDYKSIMKATGDGAIGKIAKAFNVLGEILTFPFACSDQISRRAAITSAYWHGESVLKKYSKNLKGGMNHSDAYGALLKELHMKTFNGGNDFDHIMGALDQNDILRSSKEFLYRYATRSMNQNIFNYSSSGQSLLKGYMKQKDPILGVAMTFTSWPMYFHEMSKGALIAWKGGDKEPLQKLIVGGLVTFAAASHAMGSDSEYQKGLKPYMNKKGMTGYAASWASEMPAYLQARAPGLSYAAFVEKTTASPAGILSPAIGIISYPILKAIDEVGAMMGNDSGKGSASFMLSGATRYAKGEMIFRKMLGVTQTFKEVGLMDEDLNETIKRLAK